MCCVTWGNGSPRQTESLQTAWAPRQPAALPPGTFRQIRGRRRVELWNCVRRKTPSSERTSELDLSVCFHLCVRDFIHKASLRHKTESLEYQNELLPHITVKLYSSLFYWALWLVPPLLWRTVNQSTTVNNAKWIWSLHCTDLLLI